MPHLTQNTRSGKPQKPYPDYPLYAHATRPSSERFRRASRGFARGANYNGSRMIEAVLNALPKE